jgi:hypothetical protein
MSAAVGSTTFSLTWDQCYNFLEEFRPKKMALYVKNNASFGKIWTTTSVF